MIVVSLFLILNFSIGVSASTNYDRQEADACITITLLPLQHMKTERKKMTEAEMKREGVYQFVLSKWFVYSKEGSEVVHFIEQKYGAKWI